MDKDEFEKYVNDLNNPDIEKKREAYRAIDSEFDGIRYSQNFAPLLPQMARLLSSEYKSLASASEIAFFRAVYEFDIDVSFAETALKESGNLGILMGHYLNTKQNEKIKELINGSSDKDLPMVIGGILEATEDDRLGRHFASKDISVALKQCFELDDKDKKVRKALRELFVAAGIKRYDISPVEGRLVKELTDEKKWFRDRAVDALTTFYFHRKNQEGISKLLDHENIDIRRRTMVVVETTSGWWDLSILLEKIVEKLADPDKKIHDSSRKALWRYIMEKGRLDNPHQRAEKLLVLLKNSPLKETPEVKQLMGKCKRML